MVETPWEVRKQGVLLLVDHIEDDFHQWVFLPGYKDAPVTVKRDWLGRGVSTRAIGDDWVLLICNNSDCPARAAYRSRLMEETVERLLPVPIRQSQGSGSTAK